MRAVSLLLPLLLVGCGDVRDSTFVLGAGLLAHATAYTLDPGAEGDLPAVTRIDARDGWSGAAEVTLTAVTDTLDCGGTACAGAWTGTLTLEYVVLHDGGQAARDDAGFDCVYGGFADDVCDADAGFDFNPPDVTLTGTFDLILGWRASDIGSETQEFWHITATAPALRAQGFAADRTADLALTYDADWDEYSGHVDVQGTVDGAPSGYDHGWTD